MRTNFDRQLQALNGALIKMGDLCEEAIDAAASALLKGDRAQAQSVQALVNGIDQKARDIENDCMRLLLMQQPVAGDLRRISAALKMVTDMERIGVQSGDIAEIVATAPAMAAGEALYLGEMARETIKMVNGSVDAFVKRDAALSKRVIAHDDVVDGLFTKTKQALGRRFLEKEQLEQALDLLMIAKYFERIGDHAVNIAQWVLYAEEDKP